MSIDFSSDGTSRDFSLFICRLFCLSLMTDEEKVDKWNDEEKKNSYQEWMKPARVFHIQQSFILEKFHSSFLPQLRKHWARHENSIDILFLTRPSLTQPAFLFPPVFISIQRIKKRERRRRQKTTDKENPSERVSCFSLFFFFFLSGSFYEGEEKKMFFFQFQVMAKASFIKYSTSIMSWENTEAKILRIERTTFFCLILKYAN